jgi:hypothetical protein
MSTKQENLFKTVVLMNEGFTVQQISHPTADGCDDKILEENILLRLP